MRKDLVSLWEPEFTLRAIVWQEMLGDGAIYSSSGWAQLSSGQSQCL